jgi:hypothetical protein
VSIEISAFFAAALTWSLVVLSARRVLTSVTKAISQHPYWSGSIMKAQIHSILTITAMTVLSGCNTTPLTTSLQPMAVDFAVKRARFDLNCPAATGSVLSSETVQPALNGPLMMGTERAQFTVGVTGCGKRETVVVLCAQGGNGCFAADGGQAQN